MKQVAVLLLVTIFSIESSDAFAAAAAVARRRQAVAAQEQALQEQAIQEEVLKQQYQAAQQQAQAQQIAQYQAAQHQAQAQAIEAYQQQQIKARIQQMLLQAQEKAAYEQAQAQAIYNQQAQMVGAQQQATVAALAVQYQQAAMKEAVRQKLTLDAVQIARIKQLSQLQAQRAAFEAMQAKTQAQTFVAGQKPLAQEHEEVEQVQDVVDITDVWRKLDTDSRAWALLIDEQAKVATISEFMDRYRKTGIAIRKTPTEYTKLIDQMAIENPSLLKNPFKNLVEIAAIMEYDFDNGVDKDMLARKMLGENLYEANKKRLGR